MPKLLWRIHKNDLVKLLVGAEERIMRVVSLWDKSHPKSKLKCAAAFA